MLPTKDTQNLRKTSGFRDSVRDGSGAPDRRWPPHWRAPECLHCASPKAGVIWKHRPPALGVCWEGLQALQAAPAEEGERAGAFQELQV